MRREIESKLLGMLEGRANSVIIVEGARQVGKSYLVNSVLSTRKESILSLDLEKSPAVRRQIDATEDFEDFMALMRDSFSLKEGILFIDEAQESRQLARYVKNFKEDLPDVRVVLTGSSMNRFFPKDMRILVGRYKSICVFGFSFSEFVQYVHGEDLADFIRNSPESVPASRHSFLLGLYDDYIKVGGYPEAVIAYAENESWTDVTNEIMASLEEDFERKEDYQPELFRDAVRAISNNIGKPSKYTHFKTTHYYAKKIISSLRAWHIAMEVEQLPIDQGKGGEFLPKRYLHDIGVLNMRRVQSIPPISLLETMDPILRTPLGALFENALLIQLLSGKSASYSVSGWKKWSQSDIEVDFICDFTSD